MPVVEDPEESARIAGLVHVDPDEPGISRRRRGRGFSYSTPTGRPLRSERVRARIDRLAIPPAWSDVWICPDPNGHIQAAGRDERGRLQYRYHDRWTEVRAARKFAQLGGFGAMLPRIRAAVTEDLASPVPTRRWVLAVVIRLLDETLLRIGNPTRGPDTSFGLTTLRPEHVHETESGLLIGFPGKGGIEREVEVTDPELIAAVGACDDLGGIELFTYRDGDEVVDIHSGDVNDRLRELAGAEVTARDFRTWGGTVATVEDLGPVDPTASSSPAARNRRFLEAVDRAAERLGNTRAVCRESYVHPRVEEAFASGELAATWRRSRTSSRHTRAERTTLRLLDAGD